MSLGRALCAAKKHNFCRIERRRFLATRAEGVKTVAAKTIRFSAEAERRLPVVNAGDF